MIHLQLPASELRLALAGLGKVVCRRSTLPVLGCVLITRQNDQLTLRATDLDTWAIYTCKEPHLGEDASLVVAFKDLQTVVKNVPSQESIQLQNNEGKVSARYHLNGTAIDQPLETVPVVDFPSFKSLEGKSIPLDAKCRQSILQAFECSSTDEQRYILNGIYLDVSNKGGHYVVATDGRHLYSSNSFKLPLKESVLIPNHKLWSWPILRQSVDEWLLRTEPSKEKEAGRIEIASGPWTFTFRQIEGNFPNWRQVIPTDQGKSVAELSEESLQFINDTVSHLPDSGSNDQPISLRLDAQGLRLFTPKSDKSWTELSVPSSKATGTPLTIHINRQYLLKAARFGLRRIEMTDRLSPLRFIEAGRKMVVMPLRTTFAGEPSIETQPPQTSESAPVAIPQPQEPMTDKPKTNPTPVTEEAPSAITNAITQIEPIREALRGALRQTNDLVDALKQAAKDQRQVEREIHSVRSTLRTLQKVQL
ncbi:MAG: hypothetical protein HY912_24245 [Desulfomonile tiedjei]|uniref:Beta sliding clamp n=1 Tax=Desulfomonile tiedjei TaxID=2358 RepID=A0A9D6V6U1_9BACT|nr:hypothetical protein [Desulfomonile tiedjei]